MFYKTYQNFMAAPSGRASNFFVKYLVALMIKFSTPSIDIPSRICYRV